MDTKNSDSPLKDETKSGQGTPTGSETGSRDRVLVRAVLEGQNEAVQRFVERMECIPRILRAQNSRNRGVLSADDIDDLAQETFSAIWKRLESFEGRASLETWVYHFCKNHYLNAIRRRGRVSTAEVEDIAEESQDAQTSMESNLDTERLAEAMADLPAELHVIVELKHFEEMTFDQIGERMSISPNTAKTRYYRALQRLRGQMQRDGQMQRGDQTRHNDSELSS